MLASLLLFLHIAQAQEQTTVRNSSLRFGVNTPSLNMTLADGSGVADVIYKPHVTSRTLVGYSYKNIGASYSFSNASTKEDDDLYGRSDLNDFQLRYFQRRYFLEFFYQNYRGYYIENTQQVDPASIDRYIKHPNLKSRHYEVRAYYTVSPEDFSPPAIFDQSEALEETGGSWLIMGGLAYHTISDSEPLVPSSVSTGYSDIADFKSGSFTSLEYGVGGAYSWVKNSWFIGIGGILGLALQHQTYDSTNAAKSKNLLTFIDSVKLSTGYHGERFFSILSATGDILSIKIDSRKLDTSTSEANLILGMHF